MIRHGALSGGLDVLSLVLLDAECGKLFEKSALHRCDEAHRQQHQVGLHFKFGARHFLHLAVLPLDPHGDQFLDLAMTADKAFGGHGPVARAALFV